MHRVSHRALLGLHLGARVHTDHAWRRDRLGHTQRDSFHRGDIRLPDRHCLSFRRHLQDILCWLLLLCFVLFILLFAYILYICLYICFDTKYFERDPVYKGETYCQLYNQTNNNAQQQQQQFSASFSTMAKNLSWLINDSNESLATTILSSPPPKCGWRRYQLVQNASTLLSDHQKPTQQPNIALISALLLVGTCVMALFLKKLRRSTFFGTRVTHNVLYYF